MKKIKALLMNITCMLMWKTRTAFAEEGTEGGTPPDTTTPPAEKTTTVNYEQLISNARKEEKEKLYPEINKLKGQVEEKIKRINELLIAIGEKDEVIKNKDSDMAELKKGSKTSESDGVKALNIKITELENLLAGKDGEIITIKLEAYKATKMAEAGTDLIPEFVGGSSPEEIDLSIETSKAKYAEIVGRIKGNVVPTTPPNSNNIPPANPNTQLFTEQAGATDVAGINLYSAEGRKQYAEIRKKMNL